MKPTNCLFGLMLLALRSSCSDFNSIDANPIDPGMVNNENAPRPSLEHTVRSEIQALLEKQ
jgi:hypothetical protein